jgi:peptidoglycan/LPS O-acetylase OafA/YrhL
LNRRTEIPALTGLRGIAALLVVWAHYSHWCAPWPASDTPAVLMFLGNTGGLAMSLFFALSGFVITYNYADLPWRAAPVRCLKSFTALRLSRLYPALLVFIAFSCLFRHAFRDMGGWIVVDILSVQSWWLFPTVASTGGPLAPAWSVSTEIGMYLMFACAMMLRPPARIAIAVLYFLIVLVAAQSISDPQTSHWFTYESPHFRMIEFAAGALLARGVSNGLIRVRDLNALTRLLSCPAFLFCGTVSYSIYLFHDVGVATIARMLGLPLFGYEENATFGLASLGLFCVRLSLALTLALGLAFAMFSLVERPAQRWLRSMPLARTRPRLSPVVSPAP